MYPFPIREPYGDHRGCCCRSPFSMEFQHATVLCRETVSETGADADITLGSIAIGEFRMLLLFGRSGSFRLNPLVAAPPVRDLIEHLQTSGARLAGRKSKPSATLLSPGRRPCGHDCAELCSHRMVSSLREREREKLFE